MSDIDHPEDEPRPELQIDLHEKFPDMRPVHRVPSLQTMNGVGTMMMGSRDNDEETGTYVKTRCFTFLFIPLIALGAYRVFDSPDGGWYFLGKVPLSSLARTWNKLFLLLVFGGAGSIGWVAYTHTEGYKASAALGRADKLAAEGKGREAAGIYRDLINGKGDRAVDAHQRLLDLLAAPPADASEAAGVFEVALDLHRQEKLRVNDLFDRGVTCAKDREESDPQGALTVLEVVAPLAARPADHLDLRRRLLERLVQKSPNDIDLASRLAVVCQEQGDDKRCFALLQPHEANLGDRDGAAILGRLYVMQGKLDPAQKLLDGFVESRVPRLRAAEDQAFTAIQNAYQSILTKLKERKAPDFDYAKANAATQDEQAALVNDYIMGKLRDDPNLRNGQQQMASQRVVVVPAALDLGMVLLQRAQGVEGDARKEMLQKAEETFLSVQGSAGQTDAFRMNLGRVYYWLGKPKEGRKLFDEYLQAHKGTGQAGIMVAHALREVGAASEARKVVEQAFEKEPEAKLKQSVALTRSLMYTDMDDKILWLGRANQGDPEVKANLAHARGSKAQQDGKDEEAARLYREALAVYAGMPENEAVLNNSALVHFSLYHLTQDAEQLQRGVDKIDRAVALKPGDTILLGNAASVLVETTARDLIGSAIDFKALKRGADLGLLSYLYKDKAGKDRFAVRLRSHAGLAKARGYYERLMVMAPKRGDAYNSLASIYELTRDLDALRAVWKRLESTELDQEQSRRDTLDFYSGKKDAKNKEDWTKALARQEETLAAARKVGGATLAVAASSMATLRMGAAYIGLPPDADAAVKLTEEADAAAPSAATRSTRIEALAFRAHQALLRDNADYAALAKKTSRSLGHQVLTWMLNQPGSLKDRALGNADLKQAFKLKREQLEVFPDYQNAYSWAFLRQAYPREADQLAKNLRTDERERLRRSIQHTISPLSGTNAMESYYLARMAGKPDEAERVLREQAKKGIPLPEVAPGAK